MPDLGILPHTQALLLTNKENNIMINYTLKMAYTSFKLSPYFMFKIACGLSLLRDVHDVRDDNVTYDNNMLRIILAARFMQPSFSQIKTNYGQYTIVSQFLSKYGYRSLWARHFIDSTCGRQQLKMACKEQNQLVAYRNHIKLSGTKWYHIDSRISSRWYFAGDAVFASSMAVYSNVQLKMDKALASPKIRPG